MFVSSVKLCFSAAVCVCVCVVLFLASVCDPSPPLARASAGTGDLEPSLSGESFLPLEPLPSESDYSFGLDLSEGACELFDFSF